MALINCPECGKEVSDTSYKCPHCGFNINVPQRGITGKIFKGIFVAFNAIMLLMFASFFFGVSQTGTAESSAAVGAIGTGMLIVVWIAIGLPLGIMSYITRAKEN